VWEEVLDMSTENARVWVCNYCGRKDRQEGPRAMAMPPVPPQGWAAVSITKLIPAHKEGTQKVGDALDDQRRSVCPDCQDRLKDILETGAYA
jgi:protein-arginine kinase activator protein McsA